MRLPLRLKLSVLIISLLAATVVLVSGFLLRTQQRTLTDEMSKRGLTIAQNLAASAKTAILTRDDLCSLTPSVFASTPWEGMSERFRHGLRAS